LDQQGVQSTRGLKKTVTPLGWVTVFDGSATIIILQQRLKRWPVNGVFRLFAAGPKHDLCANFVLLFLLDCLRSKNLKR
jgi:hypothetical protein